MPAIETNDAIDVLLKHDRWATDQLLDACASLDKARLDQPFAIGQGSLRKTLAHMLNVVQGWQAGLEAKPEPEPISDQTSIDGFRAAHHRIHDAFRRFAEQAMLQTSLHAERRGRSITAPPTAILTHILTHGTHHRAQALNMLRQLDVSPLPKSGVMEFMFATGIAH